MLAQPNAFHMVVIDDTVEGMFLKILFRIMKTCAENVCIINPSPGFVAELMTITGMNTLTIRNYMRKTCESRAGAAGAGPSVAQPPMQPSYLEQLAQVEAGTSGPSVAQPPMEPSHLKQLAQVEAGTSVAQPSSVFGAETTDEGDVSFSDLDLFLDFTQH